jgi:hypothetical protein
MKKNALEALGRIDDILARARIIDPVLNRADQIAIVDDLKVIQQCILSIEEKKDEPIVGN